MEWITILSGFIIEYSKLLDGAIEHGKGRVLEPSPFRTIRKG
jgi:hypothetical protein